MLRHRLVTGTRLKTAAVLHRSKYVAHTSDLTPSSFHSFHSFHTSNLRPHSVERRVKAVTGVMADTHAYQTSSVSVKGHQRHHSRRSTYEGRPGACCSSGAKNRRAHMPTPQHVDGRARRRRHDRPAVAHCKVAWGLATRLRDQHLVLGVVDRKVPQRTRRALLLASRAALHQRHERRDGASLRDQHLVLGVDR